MCGKPAPRHVVVSGMFLLEIFIRVLHQILTPHDLYLQVSFPEQQPIDEYPYGRLQ